MRTVRETYLREMLEGRHLMLTQGRERKIVVYTMGGVSGRKTERERGGGRERGRKRESICLCACTSSLSLLEKDNFPA